MTEEEQAQLDQLENLITGTGYLIGEYKEFFDTSEKRIELLNQSASYFFGQFQVMLLETINLNLCKLLDPLQSCNQTNLNLELFYTIADNNTLACSSTIQQKIQDLKSSSQFREIKLRRNKWVSHFDLNKIMNDQIPPLIPSSTFYVWKNITNIMNIFHGSERDTEMEYIPISRDNAEFLLDTLNRGVIYKGICRDRSDWIKDKEESESYGFDLSSQE